MSAFLVNLTAPNNPFASFYVMKVGYFLNYMKIYNFFMTACNCFLLQNTSYKS